MVSKKNIINFVNIVLRIATLGSTVVIFEKWKLIFEIHILRSPQNVWLRPLISIIRLTRKIKKKNMQMWKEFLEENMEVGSIEELTENEENVNVPEEVIEKIDLRSLKWRSAEFMES